VLRRAGQDVDIAQRITRGIGGGHVLQVVTHDVGRAAIRLVVGLGVFDLAQ
jgi:hypothetical protein